MYTKWSKDDGSTSSFQKLIIPRLPRFEKLAFSQFKLYIETETTNQFFVCCNFQKAIIIQSAEGKDKFFCIFHMLSIHTGFLKSSKTNVYDLHLKKMNPFDIRVSCIKIARSEVLFEQYKMALNRGK